MNNNIFDMLIGMLSTIPVAGVANVNTMKNVFDILKSMKEKMDEPEVGGDGG